MTAPPDLSGRVAVVTGASRGLGFAIGKALGAAGAHVVAIARTVGGLEELDDAIKAAGGSATLVPLDLVDHDALDRLGAALFERHGKVDILVANAAQLGSLRPVGHVEPKTWTTLFSVNVTAHWRLIRSLDPLLRQSEAGRVVAITDPHTIAPEAYWGAYAASKAALDAIVLSYAEEVRKTSIRVNLFQPDPMPTALRGKALPGEDRSALADPDEMARYVAMLCGDDVGDTGRRFSADAGALRAIDGGSAQDLS